MPLVLILLYALWDIEGIYGLRSRRNAGLFKSDVTEIPTTSQRTLYSKINSKISKRDLWQLLSSATDLISLKSTNGTQTEDSMTQTKEIPLIHSINPISSHLNVQLRLRKLEYYFTTLNIFDEDCRLRLLCEVAQDPAKFSPLTVAFLDETRFIGDEKSLASRLLNTDAGTRLLTYIEATLRGNNGKGCEIWTYRCPKSTESMINYQTLLFWREVSKWLTVKMISKT